MENTTFTTALEAVDVLEKDTDNVEFQFLDDDQAHYFGYLLIRCTWLAPKKYQKMMQATFKRRQDEWLENKMKLERFLMSKEEFSVFTNTVKKNGLIEKISPSY